MISKEQVKPGAIFKGNVNGRMIKILRHEYQMVQYEDLKYHTVFNVGIDTFIRFDLSLK